MITGILFFGGYRSTEADVESWANSATKQNSISQVHPFHYPENASAGDPLEHLAWANSAMKQNSIISQVHPFHYPENASAGDPLERWNSSDAFKAVHDLGQADQLIIVGHSSGCAYANFVAQKLIGQRDFKLIALDGFVPNAELLKRPSTEVWSACNVNADVYSLNYWRCKSRAGDRFHIYEANVERRWPLHFSLVNEAVSDNYADITEGYRGCVANLKVLGLDAVQS